MGLRTMGATVRLNDYKDELIGLRFESNQTLTTRPEGPDSDPVEQTVPRAEVVLIKETKDGLVASLEGRSLIFQRAIATDIQNSSDWAVGRLVENERPTPEAPDATMYELSAPDVALNDIADAFEAAHIAL